MLLINCGLERAFTVCVFGGSSGGIQRMRDAQRRALSTRVLVLMLSGTSPDLRSKFIRVIEKVCKPEIEEC